MFVEYSNYRTFIGIGRQTTIILLPLRFKMGLGCLLNWLFWELNKHTPVPRLVMRVTSAWARWLTFYSILFFVFFVFDWQLILPLKHSLTGKRCNFNLIKWKKVSTYSRVDIAHKQSMSNFWDFRIQMIFSHEITCLFCITFLLKQIILFELIVSFNKNIDIDLSFSIPFQCNNLSVLPYVDK